MSRNNVFEKVVDFSEAESTRRERERLLSEHVHNDVDNDDDDDDMCWHEIHRCCHCFTIRGGVFLIAGLHITTLAILMAESIVQYGYPDDEIMRVIFTRLRLQDNLRQIALMAAVTGAGELL